jgi:tRNA pseudouridine55 synthase
VDRAEHWFPPGTRIGHTGTLDPLASGVLVLTVGRATRLVEYVQRMEKTYRTTLTLGARSDTDDAEGNIQPVPNAAPPDRSTVTAALDTFVGEIAQVPPVFSAANVMGQRAYSLARRGRKPVLESKAVHVHAIDLLAYDYPRLDLQVRCGKGTYIRSLARDLGEKLGCGAYVQVLRRTRVGCFCEADGVDLDCDANTVRDRLLPLVAALTELPKIHLSADHCRSLRFGQRINLALELTTDNSMEAAALDPNGDLVGVISVEQNRIAVPLKVF